MKEFLRTSKPEHINYNGKKFTNISVSLERKGVIIGYCNAHNYSLIQVNVLSAHLRGRDNLHGKPYQPSEFIFCSPEMPEDEKEHLEGLINEAKEFHNKYPNTPYLFTTKF